MTPAVAELDQIIPRNPTRITSIVKSGSNVEYPMGLWQSAFQVQFKNDLNAALWSNSGGPTSTRSASIAIVTRSGFLSHRWFTLSPQIPNQTDWPRLTASSGKTLTSWCGASLRDERCLLNAVSALVDLERRFAYFTNGARSLLDVS